MTAPYGVSKAEAQAVSPLTSFVTNLSSETWTVTDTSGVLSSVRTAAANTTATLVIPFPGRRRADQSITGGIKITSAEVSYRIGTAALGAVPTVTLVRQNTLAVAGRTVDNTVTNIPVTVVGNELSTDANDGLMTITVDTPDWDFVASPKAHYYLKIVFNAATTSAIRVYPVLWNYTELT